MRGETALFLVRLVGFAGFLWLGLYVVTRGDRGRVATLFGLTALATACFFLSVGLLSAVQDGPATVPISRVSWWASVVPVALWLHLSLDLNPRTARTRWRRPAQRSCSSRGRRPTSSRRPLRSRTPAGPRSRTPPT